MKQLRSKISLMKLFTVIVIAVPLIVSTANAQNNGDMSYRQLEKVQDENMDYLKEIHKIIKDYPNFAYTYTMENGKVVDVTVTGVEDKIDKKRLEVAILDLKTNRNMIKNATSRLGVFYSVDKYPEFKGGTAALQKELLDNLKYPEDAKTWGISGTIYVTFVVDENGNIPFATTTSDIKTEVQRYLGELEMQAVDAVKETSGEWKPGQVDGVDVASLAVVPITFDYETDPTLPIQIR